MKATSGRTIYPNIDMIQWWKIEKSVSDHNYPVGVFPFVFQTIFDDDFCQMGCVISNPSS
jgi:hypothetical protein